MSTNTKTHTPYTALSLFSVLGGDSHGLKQSGCNVIAYNELKPKFCDSHEAKFPGCELIKDGDANDITEIGDACFASANQKYCRKYY